VLPDYNISPNTPVDQFKTYVIQAQKFDFKNLVSDSLYSAINTAIAANVAQYRTGRTYATGDKVFYLNNYYTALQSTTEVPLGSTEWEAYELMNFVHHYVKKWLAGESVCRYLPFLGVNATQWGLEQYSQEGFGQVTDKRRGEMLNSYVSEASVYLSKMANELKRVNYTFDGVTYAEPCNKIQRKNPFTII
jgi:hypothetical protein